MWYRKCCTKNCQIKSIKIFAISKSFHLHFKIIDAKLKFIQSLCVNTISFSLPHVNHASSILNFKLEISIQTPNAKKVQFCLISLVSGHPNTKISKSTPKTLNLTRSEFKFLSKVNFKHVPQEEPHQAQGPPRAVRLLKKVFVQKRF